MVIQITPETTTSFLRLPHLYHDLIGKDKVPFRGDVLLIGAGERKVTGYLSQFPQVDEIAHCLEEGSTLYVADCNREVVDRVNSVRDRNCLTAWQSFELLNENIVEGPSIADLISFFCSRKSIAPVEAFRWNVGIENFPEERTKKLFDVIIVTFSAFYYSSDATHASIYQACISHLKNGGVLYLDKVSVTAWNNAHKNQDIFPEIKESLEAETGCTLTRKCILLNTRISEEVLEICSEVKILPKEFTPLYKCEDANRPCYIYYFIPLNKEMSVLSSSPLYAIHKA